MNYSKVMIIMVVFMSWQSIASSSIDPSKKFSSLIPENFSLISKKDGVMDKDKVTIFRYERSDKKNGGLGGEHFSLVVSEAGVLKGFTQMDGSSQNTDSLPDKETAVSIMKSFLEKYANDLSSDMVVKWVDKHDEHINLKNNAGELKKTVVTGMKVKCRNKKDGRYFWGIINHKKQLITFERDINWSFFRRERITEQWLHDSWLKIHNQH